jgi:hypothetical protein
MINNNNSLVHDSCYQASTDDESRVLLSATCLRCGEDVNDNLVAQRKHNGLKTHNWCYNCNVDAFSCSICQTSIKGIGYFCPSCGHGGHPSHMKEWFELRGECATGCGCRCGEYMPVNLSSGTFLFKRDNETRSISIDDDERLSIDISCDISDEDDHSQDSDTDDEDDDDDDDDDDNSDFEIKLDPNNFF